ncbi:hypothetical protein ANN_18255 [Periplaneta americana]|uniref:Uncharacterized protein n=1 Tax=Periplaneta americana TaxID=6978 RepID=A0ABQ8SN90_PERAM|nr:hypothetical protein ANN_18255 [Periplaneta americana]
MGRWELEGQHSFCFKKGGKKVLEGKTWKDAEKVAGNQRYRNHFAASEGPDGSDKTTLNDQPEIDQPTF